MRVKTAFRHLNYSTSNLCSDRQWGGCLSTVSYGQLFVGVGPSDYSFCENIQTHVTHANIYIIRHVPYCVSVLQCSTYPDTYRFSHVVNCSLEFI